jgi:predicted metal-dependent peptidase
MTKINPVALDAAKQRKWVETRAALMWRCPAFTHVLFSMLNPSRGELVAVFTKDVPIAATDGSNLILNPDTFFEMSLGERVFVVAHEILHCILNHCAMGFNMKRLNKVQYPDGVTLPYDHQLMNKAMDYVINDMLIFDKIGTFPTVGLHDPKIATRETGFTEAYRKLYEADQKGGGSGKGGGGSGKGGGGSGKGGFDTILDPGSAQGTDPAAAAGQRNQSAWDTAVAAALASAKAQGKLPAGLERMLSELIEPQVTWQDHIRAFFARRVGGGGYNWRRPDRRLILRDIIAPQRMGNGCGEIVVAIDTSGSIGQKQLNTFFGELRGIIGDLQPPRVHVVWCDAKVHRVDECENTEDVGGLKAVGGGGTDFRPVFDWIEAEGVTPDALIYMTDGLGSFPEQEPRYPVLWCAIKGYRVTYPFGEVVEIDIK